MTQGSRNFTILSGTALLIVGAIITILHLTGPTYQTHGTARGVLDVKWIDQQYLATGAIIAGVGLIVLLAGALASKDEEKKAPAAPAPKTPENPPNQ